jgi:hypothetical protein
MISPGEKLSKSFNGRRISGILRGNILDDTLGGNAETHWLGAASFVRFTKTDKTLKSNRSLYSQALTNKFLQVLQTTNLNTAFKTSWQSCHWNTWLHDPGPGDSGSQTHIPA